MKRSTSVGLGVSVVAAAGVFTLYFFGGGEEDWMLRAARGAASHCVTEEPCANVGLNGAVIRKPKPPLAKTSLCAEGRHWQALGQEDRASLLFTCTDGATYLVHVGDYRDSGALQWMRCADAHCRTEAAVFTAPHP